MLLGAEGSVASDLQLTHQECSCMWVCFKGGRCTCDKRSVSASHTFSFHEGLDYLLEEFDSLAKDIQACQSFTDCSKCETLC